jgi:pimeloyl-ACP methyl ester carboxylesterase
MVNPRIYGAAPFTVAVLHGGPGAPGTMAPVARELAAAGWGVLEPLQTADTLDGQVEELRAILAEYASAPVSVLGSSWGAMLGFIFAARHPAMVKKLILIGSGVYEERFAADIERERQRRMSADERRQADAWMEALDATAVEDKDTPLAHLGALSTKTDAYDPITLDTETLEVSYRIHQRVWQDAVALRRSGEVLALGRRIACPVVAIHGDYDPHPAAGIREPLAPILRDFRFIPLAHCGHLPWIERQARDTFFALLRTELAING